MAQKRIRMVRQDVLGDKLRLLYDDGTQGVLCYGEAVSRSKVPVSNRPNPKAGQDETGGEGLMFRFIIFIIGLAVLFIDAAQMLKAYRERNTAGVLFWGILLLAVSIGMS